MGRSLLLFVFLIAAFFQLGARQQRVQSLDTSSHKVGVTTIYLVRHAEKVLSDPQDKDPGLTAAGLQRAEDLKEYLENKPVDVFFSTPYKRTQLTVAPLAKGRPIQFYDAHDAAYLKSRILKEYRGKTILVVGHSNTLLPIIEAFGAKKPVHEIGENQYDNLFRITVSPKGKVRVQALKYGSLTT